MSATVTLRGMKTVNCRFCQKKLRADNNIGTCRTHRALSESRKVYMSEYADNNKEKIKEIKRRHQPKATKHYLERRKTDPAFKLTTLLRNRLGKIIRSNAKKGSAVRDLGCTSSELKTYLEQKFAPGMTWENHGEWHIDHIIPLASFNLTDREQFLKACHYTNLQPLWALDNIIKSDRI